MNSKKIKKQKITEIVAEVSPWDLTGSLDKIYWYLLDTQKTYINNIDDVIEYGWDWDDDENHFVLTVTRLENNKEYNSRVKKLMKTKS